MATVLPLPTSQAEPGSPEWWLHALQPKLEKRREDMLMFDDYYAGRHPLPFLTNAHSSKIRSEFRLLLEQARSNFMRLVVDAAEERLKVEGFRLSASADEAADERSWAIWQANQLDAESQTGIVEAMVKGLCYLSVWAADEDGGYPVIAVEDPTETIVAYTPGSNYRRRDAALKVWKDELRGVVRANVYLPDGISKFVADEAGGGSRSDWREWTDEPFVENPLGIVPIVPLRNRSRLTVEGESELVDVVATQDRINGQLFLRALAGYFGAHRQRWATGITLEEDESGNFREPFDVAIDRLWASEGENVKFGEFEQTDLGGYISAIEQDVLHIAVTSRTPRHYLIEQGQSPSGDAIRSAEAGLVAKVRRKMRPFGECFEEVLRLARRFDGLEEPPPDSEIIWADPQTRTEAETTDAVIKKFQAGLIPWRTAVEDLGYTQTEIARMAGMRTLDQVLQPTPSLAGEEDAVA